MSRKIIQIAGDASRLFALCEDGSVWTWGAGDNHFKHIGSIPIALPTVEHLNSSALSRGQVRELLLENKDKGQCHFWNGALSAEVEDELLQMDYGVMKVSGGENDKSTLVSWGYKKQ